MVNTDGWVRKTARTEVERRRRRRSIMTSKEKENSRARATGPNGQPLDSHGR